MNKIQTTIPFLLAVCLALSLFSTASARSEDPVESARKLIDPAVNPVVNVNAVVNIELGMMGQQVDEVKTVGMVIDPSGLTLVSRTALNPHGYEPSSFEAGPGMEINVETEITSIWIQLADGKRIDAEVVLTDPDLDLSFIRRVDAEDTAKLKLTPAPLNAKADDVSLLDRVIVLSRLGKDAGWAPMVRLERVTAVLDTPWCCLAIDAEPGDTVFDASGRLLGIVVIVPAAGSSDGAPPAMMGGSGATGTTVALPLSHFRSLIDQARGISGEDGAKRTEGAAPAPAKVPAPVKPKKNLFGQPIEKGAKAPGFSLVDEKGKRHSLSDYSGKHVLLDWWGSW